MEVLLAGLEYRELCMVQFKTVLLLLQCDHVPRVRPGWCISMPLKRWPWHGRCRYLVQVVATGSGYIRRSYEGYILYWRQNKILTKKVEML